MTPAGQEREEAGQAAPRWAFALAAVAVAVVLAVASVALGAFRDVAAERKQLVGSELEALLEAERLDSEAHLTAQIFREYLLTGARERLRDLDASAATVRDLLARAAARPDTAAVASAALADENRAEALWASLAEAGGSAATDPALVRRWLDESLPLRGRLDAAVAQIQQTRLATFSARRAGVEREARRLLWSLLGTSAAALATGAMLLALLRRSVEDFRASERRFRTVFEHAPVGMALVALDGRWLRLNARYLEILGAAEDDLRRRTTAETTHPDDVEAELRQARRVLAGEIDGYALEKRHLRKDGGTAWVNATASLVRDDAGRPRYFILAAEDVGERKEFERRLRDAVQARDEFMQVASHELRTPLTTLQLQVESLRGVVRRGGTEGAKLEAKADAALRQAGRLGALVERLLDVAHLDETSFTIRPELGDLASAVREAADRMRGAAARENVELHVEAPQVLPVTFDAARIAQALAAVLSNAVKYGPGRPVDVRLEVDGSIARISVRDRGIGVGAAERDRIFGRFERAVSTRHYGGLGLGLFVTRRIVEAHGGAARVDDAPGGGSVFVLELPLSEPREARAQEATPGYSPSGGSAPR